MLVSMMSAPASRNAAWTSSTTCGRVEAEQVVVALEVAGMVGETLAAIGGLVEFVRLDVGAHRAVEDDDAFAQQGFERMERRGIGHEQE